MSELADETDSKSVIRKGVWVQVPLPALLMLKVAVMVTFSFFVLYICDLFSDIVF